MRVAVIDTNVFLSALLRGRGTRPVLDALLAHRFHLVISRLLIDELTSVLDRPQWQRALDPQECRGLLAIIRKSAFIVEPSHAVTACRDVSDNAVLECAIAGHAEAIVTGDADLLSLHPFRGIDILRPAEFLRHLR